MVITKKPQREGEHWSDLASSYSITVEPVPVIGGREGRQRTGTGDTVMGGRKGEGTNHFHFWTQNIKFSFV